MKQYKAIHIVGDTQPNCLIPEGTFTEEQLRYLESQGHIAAVDPWSPDADFPPAGDPAKPLGNRNLDPRLLRDKDLGELNAMVIERGGTEEYETPEECIAFLSEFFKEGTKVQSPAE